MSSEVPTQKEVAQALVGGFYSNLAGVLYGSCVSRPQKDTAGFSFRS